jgi:hypothetical protein
LLGILFINSKILQYREKINDISSLATNEATLEAMLNKIVELWKRTDFAMFFDASKDTYYLMSTEEVQMQLEDSQVRFELRFVLMALLEEVVF